jgi:hypothetical protein
VSQASGGRIQKKIPRKPKKDCSYVPSSLRPHVCASDRLSAWQTPHTLSFYDELRQDLSVDALVSLFEVVLLSLDENTRSNYGAGLLRFTQFCDSMHVPETRRMPASEGLLAAFAATGAAKVSRSCVDSWLAGLHFWHTFNGAIWHGQDSDLLSKVKAGISKMVPALSRRAKRSPVTIDHMYALYKGLDLTLSFDAAVWGLATSSFSGCCRLAFSLLPHIIDSHVHCSSG